MSVDVTIPSVGESVSSGFITQWHKAEGELVSSGDLLLTLDTDKISTEITAESSGVLEILVQEGQDVMIGAVVGRISPSEEVSESSQTNIEEKREPVVFNATEDVEDVKEDSVSVLPESTKESEQYVKPDEKAQSSVIIRTDTQPKKKKRDLRLDRKAPVSPAVKLLAKEKGVDLSLVVGTGKKGSILKKDVIAFIEGGSLPVTSVKDSKEPSQNTSRKNLPNLSIKPTKLERPAPSKVEESGRITRTPLSPIRRKIADHLVSAQRDSALLTTFNECDMSSVMSLRKGLQDDFVAKFGVKLGFMSIFIKAVVDGLKEVGQINARIDGSDLITNHFYDVGVAVGSERGLVVPVIRDCDKKNFAEIEKDIARYASLANEGKLGLDDLQGGVFTISNGGIYGSMLSTPIINPPQSAILGMHNIIERPVAIDGEVVIRPMMYLALSYDHRIVDGREAVTFLRRVKDCVENPARLLVGA